VKNEIQLGNRMINNWFSWPRFRPGQVVIDGSNAGRVTRLSEFSSDGQLFSLGSFFENYRSGLVLRATFFHGKS
jgi:hypothetical protein